MTFDVFLLGKEHERKGRWVIFLIQYMILTLAPVFTFCSSSQTTASYIIRNPQPRRSSQSQPVRGRDEEQDDIVSADVEEVGNLIK